jgi:hypothetical protein
MGEIARMRERAASIKLTRREALFTLAAAAGSFVVSETVSRAVIDEVLEETRVPRSFVSTDLRPERFAEMASMEQRAALAAWQSSAGYSQATLARCTKTYTGPDNHRWMARQGSGINLWAGFNRVRDIPMAEQPDGEFGAWSAKRLERCNLTGEPVFQIVRGLVRDRDGDEKVQRYTALLLPYIDGTVDSVTEKLTA